MERGGHLLYFDENTVFKARGLSAISLKNERKMLAKLLSVCLSYLCGYPTSIQQDKEQLEQDKLTKYLSHT